MDAAEDTVDIDKVVKPCSDSDEDAETVELPLSLDWTELGVEAIGVME